MFDTIIFYVMWTARIVTAIGIIVALGMTIHAMKYDGLTGFGGMVFFVTMFLSWPWVIGSAALDELKMWWYEHIDTEKKWRERY